MPTATHVLAIDLGTSSVKVRVVGRDGTVAGRASAPYPTAHPAPGRAEQDPIAWWEATVHASRAALADAALGPGAIAAIGVTGQMHGTVLVDVDLRPVTPAIIWSDQRAATSAEAVMAAAGAEAVVAITGGRLATGFQAATLRWLMDNEPGRVAAAHAALLPKDWLRARLTGDLASDPSDAGATGLFDIHTRTWSLPLVAAAGIPVPLLPPVLASHERAGTLTGEAAAALGLPTSIPVAAGAGDAPAAALGAGVTRPGQVLLTLSTGSQAFAPAWGDDGPPPAGAQQVCTALPPGEGGIARVAATLNTGSAIRWAARALGFDDDRDLLAAAWSAPAGAGGALFVPYLAGERAPWYDAGARGAFVGLGAAHDRADLARAVVEGVTLAALIAWRPLAGPTVDHLVLAGGGAADGQWAQLIADAYGLPVVPTTDPDQSARGAALLAIAMLEDADPAEVAERLRPASGPALTPDRDRHALYAERADTLAAAHHALSSVTERLRQGA